MKPGLSLAIILLLKLLQLILLILTLIFGFGLEVNSYLIVIVGFIVIYLIKGIIVTVTSETDFS